MTITQPISEQSSQKAFEWFNILKPLAFSYEYREQINRVYISFLAKSENVANLLNLTHNRMKNALVGCEVQINHANVNADNWEVSIIIKPNSNA